MVVNKPYKKGLIPGRVTKHLQELLKLVAKDYALWKSYEIVPLKKILMLYQAFSQTLIWAVLTRSFISQGHKEIACAATYTSLMQPESQLKRGDSIYFGLTRTCLMTTSLLNTWRGVYSVAHLLNHSSDWQFSGTYTMLPLLKKKTNRFLPSSSVFTIFRSSS